MRDVELFPRFMTDNGHRWEWKLYPPGGNEFVMKRYLFKLVFGDGYLTYGGENCKKL